LTYSVTVVSIVTQRVDYPIFPLAVSKVIATSASVKGDEMRRAGWPYALSSAVLVVGALTVAGPAVGQESHDFKPTVSNQPLSGEQLAIYKIILHGWMDDGKGSFNLGIETVPLELDGPSGGESCAKGLELEAASPRVVHRFRSQDIAQLGSGKAVLVDREEQGREVSKNDPENTMRRGASVEETVKNGFAHGLVTLSEIRFDVKHEHAIVWYGFVCGGLCGNGGTVVLEKKGGIWKRGKACSIWMSQLTLPFEILGPVQERASPHVSQITRIGCLGL
jgi:hypothetical protein